MKKRGRPLKRHRKGSKSYLVVSFSCSRDLRRKMINMIDPTDETKDTLSKVILTMVMKGLATPEEDLCLTIG